ncbi:MAG: hypothetical protein HZA63_07980 [Rhodocyclales bacterium]|nr:hypothetical protein [Rhodocyclales bacterium]
MEIADPSLEDYALLNLDVVAIVRWANHQDPIIRRYRTQFLDTLPVLVPMLVFRDDDPFSEAIIGWIDNGEPLIDNIASLFHVKKSTFQFLAGKPLSWISSQWIGDEMALAYAVDVPPPDKLPQSVVEWEIFSEFAKALMPIPEDAICHVFRDLCVHGYQSSRDEMLDIADNYSYYQIGRYLAFLEHWLADLIQAGRHPTQSSDTNVDVSEYLRDKALAAARKYSARLVARYSPASVYRLALDWKRKLREAVSQAQHRSNDPELKQWQGLLPRPFVFGRFQITSLTTIEEVLSEGQGLESANASYAEDCTLGFHYLVSLRDEERKFIGAAEFFLLEGWNGWISPQVLTNCRANGEYAYQEEVDAIEALQRWLNSQEHQAWLRSLVEDHKERRGRIREKLDGLEALDFAQTCHVMRQILDNYDEVVDEVSRLP